MGSKTKNNMPNKTLIPTDTEKKTMLAKENPSDPEIPYIESPSPTSM